MRESSVLVLFFASSCTKYPSLLAMIDIAMTEKSPVMPYMSKNMLLISSFNIKPYFQEYLTQAVFTCFWMPYIAFLFSTS
jgi:hypothetical protein